MHYLEKPELERFLSVITNEDHRLFFAVLFGHALRVSECLAIEGRHIHGGYLRVKRLKNGLPCEQPIRVRGDVFDESALITKAKTTPGRLFQMSRQRVDVLSKRYGRLVGIERRKCHSHSIGRHSMGMALYAKTKDLSLVQSYLSHRDASSSMVYLFEENSQRAINVVAGL